MIDGATYALHTFPKFLGDGRNLCEVTQNVTRVVHNIVAASSKQQQDELATT